MSIKNKEKSVLSLFVVDAFSRKPFEGNPAAVVLIPFNKDISRSIKQKIAAEMNLSETAFITVKSETDSFEKSSRFQLEWFTPACEVPLCGHATLASAAVLFTSLGNQSKEIEFETLSGVLKVKYLASKKFGMDLPAYDSHSVNENYDVLIKSVVGSLPVQNVALSDSKMFIIQLPDKTTRKQLESVETRDHELLAAAPYGVRGVLLTLNTSEKMDCRDEEGKQFDFICRYFGPWEGVSEDPVTGSAYSVLAPYWSKILGKNSFHARQCSSRGGNLSMELVQDRVHIFASAVIVVQGQISF